MKRQTKAQKFNDIANAVEQINKGKKVKRIGAKDGSIATKSVVSVDETRPEREVTKDCILWLHRHRVFCKPHDAGTFQNDRGQWGTYGIKGSGDIHGMLRYDGRHFEVECKRGSGGRLSIEQQKRMKDVENNSGLYFIVHGVKELEYYMREHV